MADEQPGGWNAPENADLRGAWSIALACMGSVAIAEPFTMVVAAHGLVSVLDSMQERRIAREVEEELARNPNAEFEAQNEAMAEAVHVDSMRVGQRTPEEQLTAENQVLHEAARNDMREANVQASQYGSEQSIPEQVEDSAEVVGASASIGNTFLQKDAWGKLGDFVSQASAIAGCVSILSSAYESFRDQRQQGQEEEVDQNFEKRAQERRDAMAARHTHEHDQMEKDLANQPELSDEARAEKMGQLEQKHANQRDQLEAGIQQQREIENNRRAQAAVQLQKEDEYNRER